MNNNDHSKTKLLNKNIKVTDKDIYEFNAWIKGKKITPKLMEKFDDVSDYEDFMYNYDPTENYSVALIEFDKPGTYGKGSEGYEYLSSIDKATYDQIIANLAKNDLKIEYDDTNDEFRVYSDEVDDSADLYLEVGEYCNDSDIYKKLSSLDQSGYESLMSKIKDKLNVDYDELNDKFVVTKTESVNYPIEPGVYKADTKEYKKLDKLADDDWSDYLDELAKYGLAIEYDNLNDSFVVTGSDNFSDNMTEVTFRTTNPKKLIEIVNAIGECGNGDHTFDIIIDPDLTKEEGGDKKFQWDGDGSDRIEISDESYSKEFGGKGTRKYPLYAITWSENTGDPDFEIHYVPNEGVDNRLSEYRYPVVEEFNTIEEAEEYVKRRSKEELSKSYSQDREKVSTKIDSSNFSKKADKWVVYLEGTEDKLVPYMALVSTDESNEELITRWLEYNTDSTKVKRSNVKVFDVEKDAHNYYNSLKSDSFSENREKVSAEMLEKAKTDGVIQKKPNGKWGIISIDAGEWWIPDYDSRENAEAALAAYHANKSNTNFSELSSEDTITTPGIYVIYFENPNIYKLVEVTSSNINSINDLVKEWPGNFVLYKSNKRRDAIDYLSNNGFIKYGEGWISDYEGRDNKSDTKRTFSNKQK